MWTFSGGRYEFSDSGDGSLPNLNIVPYFSPKNESAKATILILMLFGLLLVLVIVARRRGKQDRLDQLKRREEADKIVEMNH
jgi:hypothetical protein